MARQNKSKQEEAPMETEGLPEATETTDVTGTDAPKEEKKEKIKKLSKDINGTVVTIVEGVTGTSLAFDFSTLSDEIQAKLGPFGLGHKLGDAAAGKSGQEAINAINKVFDGLKANDWSVRAPAAEKITKSDINKRLEGLSEDEQAAAKALFERLGIKM
jgi:hypothetical protein